jgi:hypothetical protein
VNFEGLSRIRTGKLVTAAVIPTEVVLMYTLCESDQVE